MCSLVHRLTSVVFTVILAASVLASTRAQAHPFANTEYSLRTAFKVSDQGLVAFVVLEIPIPVVMKGIGVTKEDDLATKKRKVERYNQSIWSDLADGLTLTVDGEAIKGEWMAIEHELNGKAAEGFFVYMVGYALEEPDALASRGSYTVSVVNTGWSSVPMWYSGSAIALAPWKVDASTARDVLGDKSERKLTDPDRWTRDDQMRHLVVTVSRATNAP